VHRLGRLREAPVRRAGKRARVPRPTPIASRSRTLGSSVSRNRESPSAIATPPTPANRDHAPRCPGVHSPLPAPRPTQRLRADPSLWTAR
jgi:hypothetical protein